MVAERKTSMPILNFDRGFRNIAMVATVADLQEKILVQRRKGTVDGRVASYVLMGEQRREILIAETLVAWMDEDACRTS